jgi:hypothetical protein
MKSLRVVAREHGFEVLLSVLIASRPSMIDLFPCAWAVQR